MATDWKIGDCLESRWEIHKIFRGGMGVVYIVHDREWNEALAAKTFQDAVFARDSSIAPLFRREALAWVKLDTHPNIAQALFVQEIEGKPVLFLEYVSGGDLSGWIGPKLTEDVPQALRFAIHFCDGMIHARSKGIEVHRDIKPQNCLITESGTLKITDFGLAKVLDAAAASPAENETGILGRLLGRHPQTAAQAPAAENVDALSLSQTGASAGTCTHMPPEQFMDAKHVGVTADIYSFGVMLYQMFAGRLPFSGRTFADYERLHRSQPAPPLEVPHQVLRDVVARCLAKDPAARWQDFEQLRAPLAALYEQMTGSTAPRPMAGADLDASQWLNKGVSLAALGLTDQALNCYTKALKINAQYGEAWSNKGNLLRQAGNLEEALQCYNQAVAVNPKLDLAWYNKGATHEMLGQLKEAAASLNRALELNAINPMAWSSMGVVQDKLGKHEESLACFDRSLKIHPRHVAAWSNKGNQLRILGRFDEALACHNQALEINPTLAEIWYNQANVLSDLKRYQEAITSYNKALEVDPKLAAAWIGEGNVFRAMNRPADALACYERALQVNPRSADGWYNKAVTLQKLNRLEEALAAVDQSLELNSHDAEAWMKKGDLLDAMGRHQESFAAFTVVVTLNAKHAVAWHNRGVQAKQLQNLEESLASHEEALKLDPTMEEAWMGKANMLADLGRTDESLAAYDELLKLNPRHVSGWFSKGATLGNNSRLKEAIECFQQAEQLGHPKAAVAMAACRKMMADVGSAAAPPPPPPPPMPNNDARTWHNKGADLAEKGNSAEALACFDQALALSPNAPESWYGRAVTLSKLGRPQDALASYDRVVAIAPEFALGWHSKGVLLLNGFKRYQDALQCFEKAQQLGYEGAAQGVAFCRQELAKQQGAPAAGTQDPAAWHSKGAELDAQGKPAEALECFDKALAMAPGAAESWFGRAVVLGKLNRHEEELASYDKALAIAPGFAGAWFNKGRTLGGLFKRWQEALACFEKAQQLGHPTAAQAIEICHKGLAEQAASAQSG